MAEIIHEILEYCVKFDQPLQVAFQSDVEPTCVFLSQVLPPPPPHRLVKAKHNILLMRNSYLFKIPNSQLFFHIHEKSTLKACATSM